MNPERLLQHFDRISEAPDAIPHLRRFILDLAIRGKLVKQDLNDEPASELLKRIQAEKKRLGKKENALPAITAEEVPFARSQNLMLARLEEIAAIEKGSTGIQKASPGPYPLVSLAEERSTSSEYQFDAAAAIVPIISSTGHGHASMKRLHYQEGKFALGNILCAVLPYCPALISARYLYEYLTAYKEDLLVAKMSGTANVSLTIRKIAEVPVPVITPKAQQRLDELMALCDQLETAKTEREQSRDRLVAASLYRLNSPADAADANALDAFHDYARFYFNHLPHLITHPEHIKQLRQTVLNLAIRGRLVPQDPNDEPAAELLKRIQMEKEHLVKAGKLKKPESLPLVKNSDEPFTIPIVWQWIRLGEIIESMTNGIYKPGRFYSDTGTACVRMYNIQDGNLDLSKFQRLDLTDEEIGKYRLEPRDVIVNRVNSRELVGKAAVVGDYSEPLVFEAMNIRVRLMEKQQFPDFVNLLFRTSGVRALFQGDAKQAVGQASISQPQVANILVPLPPLAEQHRIVAKVDELMTVCDQLEAQLTTTEADSRSLLEAVLHEALAPALEEAA